MEERGEGREEREEGEEEMRIGGDAKSGMELS